MPRATLPSIKRAILALGVTIVAPCAMALFAPAQAAAYAREKLFEFPDPFTAPRVTVRCVKNASAHVPCPTWRKPGRMCRKETCIGHATTIELLRVTPTLVISGPDSADEAARRAVHGIVSACAASAALKAKAAIAATPSPEPGVRAAAGFAAGYASFKACIAAASTTTVVAGILRQLEIKLERPTHWARL